MDEKSWLCGYLTGLALHGHLRTPGIRPSAIASMSVTGIAADFEWYADLSGAAILTALSADYTGNVLVSHSYDGRTYSEPIPMAQLLAANPVKLFAGKRSLWFRFRLADDNADLTGFTLLGVFERNLPRTGRS